MDSTSRVKLIIIGLVLAAVVVGYFILAQRFESKPATSSPKASTTASPLATNRPLNNGIAPLGTTTPKATAKPSGSPTILNPGSKVESGSNTDKSLTSLPKTGMADVLFGWFAISAMVSGWFLRRFPQ